MEYNSILKTGIFLLHIIGLIHINGAQASSVRYKFFGMAAATGALLYAHKPVIAFFQAGAESQKEPKGIKSVIITHPLSFGKKLCVPDDVANNFSSYIYAREKKTYKYNVDAMDELLHRSTITDPCFTTKLLNRLAPYRLVTHKTLYTNVGTYTFGIRPKDTRAEVRFDSLPSCHNMKMNSITWVGTTQYDEMPGLILKLDSFSHQISGVLSKDGTTARLQVEVVQEKYDGSQEKSVWYIKQFTRKGCEQIYQKFFANEKTSELIKEARIEQCLRTPIKCVIPSGNDVIHP